MFVSRVDLGNGTGLELVIIPLKGSTMPGRWDRDTDSVMLCVVQNNRCCTCTPDSDWTRYTEKLGLSHPDAKRLAQWMSENPSAAC